MAADDEQARPRLIDLSGPIAPGMWHYANPWFAPVLTKMEQPPGIERPVYSEILEMPLLTGTYLETAAHLDPAGEPVSEVSLERCVLVPAMAVQLESGPGARIDRSAVEEVVRGLGPPPYSGRALLLGTGWSARWFDDDFVDGGPHLTEALIEFVVEEGFSVLGGDFPRFDHPLSPPRLVHRLFAAGALVLAPLYDLGRVGNAVGQLIAAPLRIEGASASPVRAVWLQHG